MAVIDPVVNSRVADFIRGAVQSIFDSRFDWTPDAESILALMREGGMTPEQERRFRPYFDLFVEQARKGEISGFNPQVDDETFVDYPPKFDLDALLTPPASPDAQKDLFDGTGTRTESERALIDQLIAATKLYDSSEAIQELFAFTINLREFAPFNAMLLHIQKPGLTHAASAHDWWHRFGRVPKKGARPLLVLRMKGPVDFVFDVQDTEGKDLPVEAFSFPTFGNLSDTRFAEFMRAVSKEKIDLVPLDAGDSQAGWIRLLARAKNDKGKNFYQLAYNRNHAAPTRFVTVAHELAHLYLGHLGADIGRRVPDRSHTPHALMEVEAEMAAYLVAKRNGLEPRSESYLSNYKGAFEDLNLYAVTRTANAVETAMGISAQKLWNEKA
ncbi:hypothetical protein TRICHSKD4_5798 [Roseibium sp. TrichSKD4]|uniref:ImmA/IrrE family metallo-endopeptidase n=1 Tax=Roseibium sp. TrichSKD4 TaxID=744980 RepID=UPI0001E57569|nr:ImmA/IrrE family metallo-endopeptidase [Roseibium sp. TrichSKD4]EFO29958.1 hypothetical protein TRICHSKD4_5798 [Roseibium sp. TrichSKD4]